MSIIVKTTVKCDDCGALSVESDLSGTNTRRMLEAEGWSARAHRDRCPVCSDKHLDHLNAIKHSSRGTFNRSKITA